MRNRGVNYAYERLSIANVISQVTTRQFVPMKFIVKDSTLMEVPNDGTKE